MKNILVIDIPFNPPYQSNNFISAEEKLKTWLDKNCQGQYEIIADCIFGELYLGYDKQVYQFHIVFDNPKDKFYCHLVWK